MDCNPKSEKYTCGRAVWAVSVGNDYYQIVVFNTISKDNDKIDSDYLISLEKGAKGAEGAEGAKGAEGAEGARGGAGGE